MLPGGQCSHFSTTEPNSYRMLQEMFMSRPLGNPSLLVLVLCEPRHHIQAASPYLYSLPSRAGTDIVSM